ARESRDGGLQGDRLVDLSARRRGAITRPVAPRHRIGRRPQQPGDRQWRRCGTRGVRRAWLGRQWRRRARGPHARAPLRFHRIYAGRRGRGLSPAHAGIGGPVARPRGDRPARDRGTALVPDGAGRRGARGPGEQAHHARGAHKLSGMVTLPRLAAAFALTLVNWGSQIASYHWAAMATHFPITVAGSIAAMITSNVGFLLRLTPGNVGVFQFVYALTAQALGLSRDAAVGTALLLQLVQN